MKTSLISQLVLVNKIINNLDYKIGEQLKLSQPNFDLIRLLERKIRLYSTKKEDLMIQFKQQ